MTSAENMNSAVRSRHLPEAPIIPPKSLTKD